MPSFDNLVDSIHALSNDEKLKLRLLLDADLQSGPVSPPPAENGTQRAKGIIGLFAGEPELMDRVMESVYELRSRPLRLSS